METARIGLVGDFNPQVTAHRAIPEALRLAAAHLGKPVEPVWIGTESLSADVHLQLAGFHGIWCVPASPYANTEGALAAIRFARESKRPFLGTCGGFQHALLEYARNVLGFRYAEHAETRPEAEMLWIAPLTCALVERSGAVVFAESSRMRAIYGIGEALEQYNCSYGLNPKYETHLAGTEIHVCGRDASGHVRAIELANHPFFLATLFQPERAALRGHGHPLVNAFVAAARAG